MIHYDEEQDSYTLILKGGRIIFPNLKSLLTFAKKVYGLDLLTQLN